MKHKLFLGVFFSLVCATVARAADNPAAPELRLPALFSDHSVLQCDVDLPVWGWAAPGEEVSVSVAGQTQTAKAGADGKWKVSFKPLKSAESTELVVKSGTRTITVKDVAVGEVWVCSGQSNMKVPFKNAKDSWQEKPKAKYPGFRMFTAETIAKIAPQDDVAGAWVVCTPETVDAFSGVGYFFGRDMHKATGRPVGIIHASMGATSVDLWISKAGLAKEPAAEKELRRVNQNEKGYPERLAKYPQQLADHQAKMKEWEPLDRAWNETWKAWNQEAKEAKAAGKPEPAKPTLPVPQKPNKLESPDGFCPTLLFNGMIAPLTLYPIKGVAWYQGESDVGNTRYRLLMTRLILDWREHWGQGDFPFLFVQLPPLDQGGSLFISPEIREAQLQTWQTVPNTGMVGSLDIRGRLHPADKAPTGIRLALAARALAYGEKVEYSGPIYAGMKVDGSKAVLSFTHMGGGLEARENLIGFTIAGEDRNFVPAKATIVGQTLEVTSDAVAMPVAVRYAWEKNPTASLYNKEGLPASPFRTDDWPAAK